MRLVMPIDERALEKYRALSSTSNRPGLIVSQFNDSGIPGGTGKRLPRGVFPTRVLFMGEECAMPTTIPWSSGERLKLLRALGWLTLAVTAAYLV
jgi:hypothetical protein